MRRLASGYIGVGSGGLNSSGLATLAAYTPVPLRARLPAAACLFSGAASGLDAFSPYRLARSYGALPCRTTPKPEAPGARSSYVCPCDGVETIKQTWAHFVLVLPSPQAPAPPADIVRAVFVAPVEDFDYPKVLHRNYFLGGVHASHAPLQRSRRSKLS